MEIRAEVPADADAIRAINDVAFGGPAEARLVDAIRESPGFIPALSLVAEQDGELLGHILFSAIAIQQRDGTLLPALALAPMAVLPAHQRQGIGSALVRAGLERVRGLGHRIAVVVGHPDYYPRFGFRPARAHGLECPFSLPDEAFMALALQPGALDGVRGTVVYPAAFAEV